eukprot:1180246-Prorocentrum_minimum.AAC.7
MPQLVRDFIERFVRCQMALPQVTTRPNDIWQDKATTELYKRPVLVRKESGAIIMPTISCRVRELRATAVATAVATRFQWKPASTTALDVSHMS